MPTDPEYGGSVTPTMIKNYAFPQAPPIQPQVSQPTTVATQQQSSVAPTVSQPTTQPAKAPVNPNAFDYSGDPILMQAKAFASSANQQAQAQATARLQQLGIEYNDPNNPFSTVARLDRSYGENLESTNENYNKHNLFYSGHRTQALSRLATALQQSKYDAANQYRGQTTDVANNLANALLQNQQGVIGAEGDAYNRALQQALQYGLNPGATDTATDTGGGGGGSAPQANMGTVLQQYPGLDPAIANAMAQNQNQNAQALAAPAPSAPASSGGVEWGGQTFTTKAALSSWLSARGASYSDWAGKHPDAAKKLK